MPTEPAVRETPPSREEATAGALAFLRAADRAGRCEQRRGAAVLVYGLLLVAVPLGVPYLMAAADLFRSLSPREQAVVLDGAGPVLCAVAGCVLWCAAAAAVVRGPVRVGPATALWALPQPLLRRPLLLPRLRAAFASSVAVGAGCGLAVGLLLGSAPDAGLVPALAAGVWAGVSVGAGAVCAGVGVLRAERRWRLRVPLGGVACGVLVVAGFAGWVWARGVPEGVAEVLLWSGPWGWSVQPLVASSGAGAGGWPWAAALTAGSVVAGTVWCVRTVGRVPGASLRRRAEMVHKVTASVYALNLRQAKFTLRGPRRVRSRLRLPPPRRPWLLVPWRDVTGLLREPGRPGRAVAAAGVAAFCTVRGGAADGPGVRAVAAAGALCAVYAGAAQLLEPARVESDDVLRSANLPWSCGSLALRHALVPALLLLAVLPVALVVAGAVGFGGPVVLLLCVPGVVGAALVSAYRGAMPVRVALGVETPLGNTAPLQMAAWYLRGPLVVLAGGVPVLAGALGRPVPSWGAVCRLVVLAAALVWWARRTAARQA